MNHVGQENATQSQTSGVIKDCGSDTTGEQTLDKAIYLWKPDQLPTTPACHTRGGRAKLKSLKP